MDMLLLCRGFRRFYLLTSRFECSDIALGDDFALLEEANH
jgi:hypothetical protein